MRFWNLWLVEKNSAALQLHLPDVFFCVSFWSTKKNNLIFALSPTLGGTLCVGGPFAPQGNERRKLRREKKKIAKKITRVRVFAFASVFPRSVSFFLFCLFWRKACTGRYFFSHTLEKTCEQNSTWRKDAHARNSESTIIRESQKVK